MKSLMAQTNDGGGKRLWSIVSSASYHHCYMIVSWLAGTSMNMLHVGFKSPLAVLRSLKN
jgi:hypothetical protein